jgi:glyoxylase-like metal-dependent hydrolase (beta-lactamase superfamily II)
MKSRHAVCHTPCLRSAPANTASRLISATGPRPDRTQLSTMKRVFTVLWLLGLAVAWTAPAGGAESHPTNPSATLRSVAPEIFPDLFVWTDTCNVYVIRQGDAALLIDLGDGSVLDHLPEIGVRRVEWVLFTHHHREQCQGYLRLHNTHARIGAPEAERALFEQPTSFRKINVRLGDSFTIHGASYVRPPIQPIHVDRAFSSMDTFNWRGLQIWCVDTRGNSPGSMSYLVRKDKGWVAFSGDVMMAGAHMHDYFDTEWDYGFAAGIYALHNSAALLERFGPVLLLPSHGPIVRDPQAPLEAYQRKLRRLADDVLRGYDEGRFAGADQDRVSRPTAVPYVWQVTPHLYKFKGPNYYPNFVMLLADSGHALAVDCGLFDEAFLDKSLQLMQRRLGLKQIDALLITHMHGDHLLQAPHLREKWGARIWLLDRVVDEVEHPEWFDYAAPIQAYGQGFDSVRPDRVLKSGETFNWEGYKLTADWMPGQTEFAMCLQGVIDGRKVAFTGDNIFANPQDPSQNGHEAVVAHNSGILEEGYIYGAEYLHRLQPDLILGGHSFVMDHPAGLIERYRHWAYEMRAAFQSLSSDPDYRYWFDPYWVRVQPYRITLRPGQNTEVMVHVRNFRSREQTHLIEVHVPPGLTVEPAVLVGTLPENSRRSFPVQLKAETGAATGVNLVALDVTLDGQRYGERFDFIVQVQPSSPK